jgi:ABC-type branched-subunit amino acid transport system ATPase component
MDQEIILSADQIVARYGSVEALHGVSLSVRRGQIVALLGANGAGKSTTLRTLSGPRNGIVGDRSLSSARTLPGSLLTFCLTGDLSTCRRGGVSLAR